MADPTQERAEKAEVHTDIGQALEGLVPVAAGVAAYFSSPSPTGSGRSEDALAIVPVGPDSALLAVADGMGGLPGGREAAACAIRVLADAVAAQEPDDSGYRSIILDAIEAANREIIDTGLGSATTLAVAEIGRDFVRPYHVGDSELMLFGQRGRLAFQSVPHSPVGFAYHSGLLDAQEAMSHADRHLVSNVLGTRDMRIEVGSQIPMKPADTLVLCSDGLVDNLQLAEICEVLRAGPLDRKFKQLIATARGRMAEESSRHPSKPDDLTVIVFRTRPGASMRRRLGL